MRTVVVSKMANKNKYTIKKLNQDWASHIKNNGTRLSIAPCDAGNFAIVGPRFLEILKATQTKALWKSSYSEGGVVKQYKLF